MKITNGDKPASLKLTDYEDCLSTQAAEAKIKLAYAPPILSLLSDAHIESGTTARISENTNGEITANS